MSREWPDSLENIRTNDKHFAGIFSTSELPVYIYMGQIGLVATE